MFDTMTLTKIVGGFCGTFLVFLLGGWAAESIYGMGETHVAEGEEVHQAYVIPVEDSSAPAEAGPTVEELTAEFQTAFASADVAAGEADYRPCSACHSIVEGENRTGPYLYGVVGRPVDSVADFAYSGAIEKVYDGPWTPEELNLWLLKPQAYAPGTKMNYGGMPDVQDRANLIAYLDSLDG